MAIQRTRVTSTSDPVPERQNTRSMLTAFQEGIEPVSLGATGPAMVGDVTAGQITVDAGNDVPKVQIREGEGLRWLDPSGQLVVERFRQSYNTDLGRNIRQGLWEAFDISGDGFGTDVGRAAFIGVNNTKIPGNESAVSVDNRAFVSLVAQVATGNQALIQLESRNDRNFVNIQGADVLIAGDPVDTDVGLSRYARGKVGYGEDPNSTGAIGTTDTAVVSALNVPCIKGRRYAITGYARGIASVTLNTQYVASLRVNDATPNIAEWVVITGGVNATQCPLNPQTPNWIAPSTGTFKFTMYFKAIGAGNTGAVSAFSNSPMYVLVQDIGF